MTRATVKTWEELLRRACEIASLSPDPSTQVGSLLVKEVGDGIAIPIDATAAYNRPVFKRPYKPEWLERPFKYDCFVHSEAGAIQAAAKLGIPTGDLTLVASWACCKACAVSIIGSGITHVVTLVQEDNERWKESIETAYAMLETAKVRLTQVPGPLGSCPELLKDGKPWTP